MMTVSDADTEHAIRTFFTGKHILVTGGGGYIGTNLIARLHEVDCTLTRLTRSGATPSISAGRTTVVDIRGDIRESATWDQLPSDTNVIIHLAAQTSTYAANEDPIADLRSNVLPLLLLLETCRRRGLSPSIVLASTVTVAGIPTRLPVDESHPDHPVTIYDLHKLMAETYLAYYAEQGFVRGVSLRLSNVYGPGPESSKPDRGILNAMIRKSLQGEDLTVYGEGLFIRDYVYVDDVVAAFLLAAIHAGALEDPRVIISSGEGHPIVEAARLVADRVALKTGRKVNVRHVSPPHPQSPIESRNFVGNPARFSDATGWRARWNLAAGIDRTVEAFA